MTEEEAKQIAIKLDDGIDGLAAAAREDKVKIIKHYFDAQIGSEPGAQIKSIPGVPMLSGMILEQISDVILGSIATLIVDKGLLPGT